ncbi:MAG: hypothetical protein ACYSWP_03125 [Planctomycetota bacterium]|jgi:hypothetical protein
MIVVVIASCLNALFLLMLAVLLTKSEIPDDPAQLVLFILFIVTPLVNIFSLWYLVKKKSRAPEALKDIRDELLKIHSLLENKADES